MNKAMTFSSQGCTDAANDLNKAANTLDTILNQELVSIINKVKPMYNSETAEQLYAAFDKMKAKFPEFIQSVTECSKYLSDTVAPEYERLESAAASKIN